MQLCTEQKKTTLEQLSENLGYFYKNGWDAVLADILAMAKDSAYAKENGFANVQTKEEFLQKAPISDYNDYRPYIRDNLKNDAGQLTAQETVYYLRSYAVVLVLAIIGATPLVKTVAIKIKEKATGAKKIIKNRTKPDMRNTKRSAYL